MGLSNSTMPARPETTPNPKKARRGRGGHGAAQADTLEFGTDSFVRAEDTRDVSPVTIAHSLNLGRRGATRLDPKRDAAAATCAAFAAVIDLVATRFPYDEESGETYKLTDGYMFFVAKRDGPACAPVLSVPNAIEAWKGRARLSREHVAKSVAAHARINKFKLVYAVAAHSPATDTILVIASQFFACWLLHRYNKPDGVAVFRKMGSIARNSGNLGNSAFECVDTWWRPLSMDRCIEVTCNAYLCAGCGAGGTGLLACNGCKTARYCGRQCQKEHWAEHRGECSAAGGTTQSFCTDFFSYMMKYAGYDETDADPVTMTCAAGPFRFGRDGEDAAEPARAVVFPIELCMKAYPSLAEFFGHGLAAAIAIANASANASASGS